jgi:hypothetical protein
MLLILSLSHDLELLIIMSLTLLISPDICIIGGVGIDNPSLSQFYPYTSIFSPVPMLHLQPPLTTDFELQILLLT